MDEENKRKRGRPKKEGGRRNRVQFKMTDKELEMLRYTCDSQNKTITEVILDGVKTTYNLAKYREN